MTCRAQPEATLFCSFCGKSQHDVAKLIAGPNSVYVCNECVDLSCEIIHDGGLDDLPRMELAHLRIEAWAALKGWGKVGADGKFATLSWADRASDADRLVRWAINQPRTPQNLITQMVAADLGGADA